MIKPTRRSKDGVFITKEMATERYNLGRDSVMQLAKEAEAIIRYGRRVLIDTEKCDS